MQPSLKKNSVYRILYEILKIVTPFITAPYIARVLEADGVGNYSFTHSIVTYFMLFAALGTVGYGTREIAQNRDDKAKASKLKLFSIKLAFAGIFFAIEIFNLKNDL